VLRLLLLAQLAFVVNQLHFSFLETRIPGVATANLLFLLVLLAMRYKPETVQVRGMLYGPLLYFFASLILAFLWAQIRAPGSLVADVTYLKNALFYPLFYFIYLKCRQDEKTTRQLIIAIMVIAALAGLEAIREGLNYGFDRYSPAKRASGPFGFDYRGANRAGVFYAMFLPMFLALALFLRRQKVWRLAAIGGCLMLAGGTLFTYSRQSYFLALLATAVVLLRRSLIAAAVVGVTLVALSGYLPDSVGQRVEETKQQGAEGQEELDQSTASRFEIWEGGMQMFAANPLGVGLHRFPGEIGHYVDRYKGMDAHNFYVLTLAECGLQGLVALLFLIWSLFRLAKFLRQHTARDDTEATALAIGFTVCTVCMALGAIYGSPTLEGAVMAPYWALAGLLERYVHLRIQRAGDAAAEPAKPPLADRFPLAAHVPGGRQSRRV